MKFRKKPIVIEATQWFKPGDHPQVREYLVYGSCGVCHGSGHGWVGTLEGDMMVSEGDWIITGVKGEVYPCKPDIFDLTYEKVEE